MELWGAVVILSHVPRLVGQSHAVKSNGDLRSTNRPHEQTHSILALLPDPTGLRTEVTGSDPPVEFSDL